MAAQSSKHWWSPRTPKSAPLHRGISSAESTTPSGDGPPEPAYPELLTLRDVMAMTAVPGSAVYALMAESRFPKPIRIGSRAVRWVEQEVLDFIASRPRGGSERPAAAPDARRSPPAPVADARAPSTTHEHQALSVHETRTTSGHRTEQRRTHGTRTTASHETGTTTANQTRTTAVQGFRSTASDGTRTPAAEETGKPELRNGSALEDPKSLTRSEAMQYTKKKATTRKSQPTLCCTRVAGEGIRPLDPRTEMRRRCAGSDPPLLRPAALEQVRPGGSPHRSGCSRQAPARSG